MKITTAKSKIRCETTGCNNLSNVFVYKTDKCYVSGALKLCDECAKELLQALKKHYSKKEKTDVKKEDN
ncbi:MAG: hypothetical protein J6R88_05600 [Clostridia bacterium]|nr:hypothetical protein [Clostridia bacterium]